MLTQDPLLDIMSDCAAEERARTQAFVSRRLLEGHTDCFWEQLHPSKRVTRLLRFALQRGLELHDIFRLITPVLCQAEEAKARGDMFDRIQNIQQRRSHLKYQASTGVSSATNKYEAEEARIWSEQSSLITERRRQALRHVKLQGLLEAKRRQLMEPVHCKLCTARVPLSLLPDHSFSCFEINSYYQDLAQINMKILNLEEKSSRFRVQLRRPALT